MSINILEQVKNITKTNPNWKLLYRKLRLNGKIVDPNKIKITPSYHYKNMNLIERSNKDIRWTAVTIVGREGAVELHHRAIFGSNGDFLNGIMNSFSFGMMDMDKESVEEYFNELQGSFNSVEYWDRISDESDDSILKQIYSKFVTL